MEQIDDAIAHLPGIFGQGHLEPLIAFYQQGHQFFAAN